VEHRAVAMVEPAMRRKGWSTGWLGMDEPGLGLVAVAHGRMLRLLVWVSSGDGCPRQAEWLAAAPPVQQARDAGAL
jgi:hypothetical protein